MWGRIAVGLGSLGLYGWRVEDPKGSYAAFYDASEWLTSFFIGEGGAWGYVRNFANIILVDQADGFLLGMAFMALISVVFWPVRRALGWGQGALVHALRPTENSEGDGPTHSGRTGTRSPIRQSGQSMIGRG